MSPPGAAEPDVEYSKSASRTRSAFYEGDEPLCPLCGDWEGVLYEHETGRQGEDLDDSGHMVFWCPECGWKLRLMVTEMHFLVAWCGYGED